MAKGIATGIAEGKLEMVLEMLRNNIPIETIIKCSGFTKSQIEELQPI